jgi:hypothetical protein
MTNAPADHAGAAEPTTVTPTTPLPEAGAVVFAPLYLTSPDGQVVQLNLTTRAATGAQALDDFFAAAGHAKKTWNMGLTRPDLKAGPGATPAQPATPPPPTPMTNRAKALDTAPAAPAQPAGLNVIHATTLEVMPDSEGKVTLKWYTPGHNFPDITTKRMLDKAVELLQSSGEDWRAGHLTVAGKFTVKHAVTWAQGKPNSSGGFYKDIQSIQAG